MEEIVGYFVFQTEVLYGFTVWHGFRLVANEQPFKITAAIHNVFNFGLQQRRSCFLFFEAIRHFWTLTVIHL